MRGKRAEEMEQKYMDSMTNMMSVMNQFVGAMMYGFPAPSMYMPGPGIPRPMSSSPFDTVPGKLSPNQETVLMVNPKLAVLMNGKLCGYSSRWGYHEVGIWEYGSHPLLQNIEGSPTSPQIPSQCS